MVLVGLESKKHNTVQEIFSLVLFGLVLYYYFQYPTRKFSTSTEFKEFRELKYKISNSGIPVSFLGLRRDGTWTVLNGCELDGTGSGLVLNARDGNFPEFSGKKVATPKTRPGTQTSKTFPKFLFPNIGHIQ